MALAGGAGILLGEFLVPKILRRQRPKPTANPSFHPDVELELSAGPSEVQIFTGAPTRVRKYHARLLKGPSETLQVLEDTYLGPVLRLKKGQKIRIYFTNYIPQDTITHWHGLHVPPEDDGHPRFAIRKVEKYIYEFEIKNRAGTYWFHPHPHGLTGPQVYRGLAGLLLITDDEEQDLKLPSGEFDIPLVIQDRIFDGNNQLVYLTSRMERIWGFLGNRVLVNGKPDFTLQVRRSVYRLRILNGSNSRIYKLAWSDRRPLVVIGTDGGLLERPVMKNYLMLGPAERVDLWADFTRYNEGDTLVLKSLPFSGASSMGMMGRGMTGRRRRRGGNRVPQNGEELEILRVKIGWKPGIKPKLPEHLSNPGWHNIKEALNLNSPRRFVFAMRRMRPTINGRSFRMTAVADDEIVRLGNLEIWDLVNSSTGRGMMGGMMQMPHPVHIHGLQFQVVERTTSAGWETIKEGFVDNGWKDTVLLMPGMRVRVLLKFEDFEGLYLYHCHNLEHEDMGMMRNYLVKA